MWALPKEYGGPADEGPLGLEALGCGLNQVEPVAKAPLEGLPSLDSVVSIPSSSPRGGLYPGSLFVGNVVNHCDLDCVVKETTSPADGSPVKYSASHEPGTNSSEAQDLKSDSTETIIFTTQSSAGQKIEVYPSCVKGCCNCVYSLAGIVCQLKPCRFASIILGREHMLDYLPLLWQITDGFPIVDSDVSPYECVNYSSITCPEVKPLMDKIVKREVLEGVVSLTNEKPTCIHALGAVSKPDGGIRPITDCSRPINGSVNNHCESLLEEFCFKNISHVVAMLNKDDYMTVVDIKSAYRAVPIYPPHRKYQGFIWDWEGSERWFVDNRLCFGSSLGPMYFNKISTFLYDVLTDDYGLNVVNYLDDFIAVAKEHDSCTNAQSCIIHLLRFLGLHVSFAKVVHPAKCVVYLGIIIDSDRMELRLPEHKVIKLKNLLDYLMLKRRISKKELESLGGLLSHCSQVIRGGRVFCKRVYNLYKEITSNNARYITMTDLVRSDLKWWRNLIDNFNGSRKIISQLYDHAMVSDSSLRGFAAYLDRDWLAGTWNNVDFINVVSHCSHVVCKPLAEAFDNDNINVLELWPILMGLKRWLHLFRGYSVLVFTDNTQVMYMLLNGSSSNLTCMH